MASQGPLLAGTGADDAAVGSIAWADPGNITADDSTFATFTTSYPGDLSHYLKGTNFGFSIPSGATIDGIILEVDRKADTVSAINENTALGGVVRLVKGGVVSGSNKGSSTTWPLAETVQTYGSSSDLWGTTWTDSDINATNFGAVLAADNATATYTTKIGSVDFMRITVHYTAGGAAATQVRSTLPYLGAG